MLRVIEMLNSILFFAILGILWFFVMINYADKKTAREKKGLANRLPLAGSWGTETCLCGSNRRHWKAMDMNRPEHLVLLRCSQCGELWEEKMGIYGSKWRPVDHTYAKGQYTFRDVG